MSFLSVTTSIPSFTRRILSFSPLSLFSASEPGVWYDPSDLTTLFQDAAGTTPVTAAGQSVGLVLDKSKGLVLGPELVTNGDFSVDASWNKETGWSIAGGAANKVAGAAGSLYQAAASMAQGRTYQITFTVSDYSAGTLTPFCRGTVGTGVFANGIYTQRLVAGADSVYAINFFASETFAGSIDNVSVKELPGFHATQATAASRPTYGIAPRTGRRNLLTFTEQFDNAAWFKSGVTVTSNATTAPDLTATADRIVFNTTSDLILQDYTTTVGGNYTVSLWLRSATSTTVVLRIQQSGGALTNQVCNVTTDWQRFSVSLNVASPTFVRFVMLANSNTPDVFAWGAQLELGSTATNYQRVGSVFDVTEAGVPSLHYLSFDGVDDFLVTPTITPNTDKAQVFAGVRKLSDPTSLAAVILESSVQADANNGALFLLGRDTFTPAMYEFGTRGTTFRLAGTNNSSFAAPVTSVLTGIGDIAGDVARLRVNGSQVAETLTDQGTGNFLAYPLYIGSRGGTPLPFNGNIFSLIVRFGANLDANTITNTETWVNGKTGAY